MKQAEAVEKEDLLIHIINSLSVPFFYLKVNCIFKDDHLNFHLGCSVPRRVLDMTMVQRISALI